MWNAFAERHDLAKVQKITDTRKRRLKARLADCGGLEGWEIALSKIQASPFLLGRNDRGWRASFDFLLRESSFTKLLEGVYDRSEKPVGHDPAGIAAALDKLDADIAAGRIG